MAVHAPGGEEQSERRTYCVRKDGIATFRPAAPKTLPDGLVTRQRSTLYAQLTKAPGVKHEQRATDSRPAAPAHRRCCGDSSNRAPGQRDSFKLVGTVLPVATAGGSSPRLHLRSTLKGAAPPAPGTVAAAVGGAGSRLQPAWLV